jgi:DNA polymerase III subunit gamma/tau
MERYQNLATQLRPLKFESVVYNEPVSLVLKSMLANNKVPAGLLLSGVRGLGKTTLARIFARALNCQNRQNGYEPCNECESCKMSLAGHHPDIMEVSGSTNGNIEDIRKLMDHAMLTPIAGNYKVFVVDEAQGLGKSQSSWDALLKVLEEPPQHLVWIFCTTNKTKIPDTIKSRLVALDLKSIPTAIIAENALGIIKKHIKEKGIKVKDLKEVAEVVAFASKNSIRDSLTLLEKVIPYCKEKGWTKESALFSIGSMESAKAFAILDYVAIKDSSGLWNTIQEILESGIDPDTLFNDGIVEAIANLLLVSSGGQPLYADQYLKSFKSIGIPRILYLADVVARRTEQFNSSNNKKFMLQLISMEICM